MITTNCLLITILIFNCVFFIGVFLSLDGLKQSIKSEIYSSNWALMDEIRNNKDTKQIITNTLNEAIRSAQDIK